MFASLVSLDGVSFFDYIFPQNGTNWYKNTEEQSRANGIPLRLYITPLGERGAEVLCGIYYWILRICW